MCSSYPENILPIIHLIADLRPKSVLDIGMGNGKYGFLIKEYFNNPKSTGWPYVEKVDGLDVYKGYTKPHHKCCYDSLTYGNILEMDIPRYDLYLLIDTLEHWPKPEAKKLLESLLEKGNIIISTPKFVEEQDHEENQWDAHISQWYPGDFDGLRVIKNKSDGTPSFIYALGNH